MSFGRPFEFGEALTPDFFFLNCIMLVDLGLIKEDNFPNNFFLEMWAITFCDFGLPLSTEMHVV